MRIIFAISGASGMPLAATALSYISALPDIELHLIISHAAYQVMRTENLREAFFPTKFASHIHEAEDFSAPPASGSWLHDGMIVCPCSMSSLASIATGAGSNLIHRAADVALKERRPLILVIRETPLNIIHLNNMRAVAEAGGIVMPFIPAFYVGDNSMKEAMRQFTGRMLDLLHIPHKLCERWQEG